MRLTLNGEPRSIDGVSTLEELIAHLKIHRMIVVEHNGTIVRSRDYAGTRLEDGDVVEIVHMVGGG